MSTSRQREQVTDLEVLGNLTNKTLEGQLANQQLRRLLVSTNFTKSHRSRTESVRLLHTTGRLQTISAHTQYVKHNPLTLAAVLRAADLAASCLRGALPATHSLSPRLQLETLTYHQWSCGQSAWYGPLLECGKWMVVRLRKSDTSLFKLSRRAVTWCARSSDQQVNKLFTEIRHSHCVGHI